ncbi:MAG: glycogen/starch/alpha-glucan family phosphorylase, partial [Candidatus Cloacimonas sp.]|nr:glycogen/starch/alpha-glucan family phosphorylase [Candidatus Cloacimonas sp.]
RLQQEYFFVSATLQDIFSHWKRDHNSFTDLPEKIAIQLNDTHPALAIPEMMRILIDEDRLSFDSAWEITKRCFSFTNHTILPEALEKWSISLFEELLPRHLLLIYQINSVVMEEVIRLYPGDIVKMRNVSIIEETNGKAIRMAQLAIHSAHKVNGVAKLHTKILCERIFPDLAEMYPDKFHNITNGITPRLWLHTCNPQLASLITEYIGNGWIRNLEEISKIEQYIDNYDFRTSFAEVKQINKNHLSKYIYRETGIRVQDNSLFYTQIKRLHEYKRQLLNVLGAIARYFQIKDNPQGDFVPHTVIFAGKAAPGYYLAKRLIKLINNIGEVVNKDPDVKDRLKVVFLPNYSVSLAEKIIPATDLSIQISTAGYEASGTGNMKFALNGALTLGTLDGANIEMSEEIGIENMFIFGLNAEQVRHLQQSGYNPYSYYENDPELKRVVDSLIDGSFEEGEKGLFLPIWKSLMEEGDLYLNLVDFRAFMDAFDRVDTLYQNREQWITKAIINVSKMGRFSSDRAIMEYANQIWNIQPLPMVLNNGNNNSSV